MASDAGLSAQLWRLSADTLRCAVSSLGARSAAVDSRRDGVKKELVKRLVAGTMYLEPQTWKKSLKCSVEDRDCVAGSSSSGGDRHASVADLDTYIVDVRQVKAAKLRDALDELTADSVRAGVQIDTRTYGTKLRLATRLVEGWAQIYPNSWREKVKRFTEVVLLGGQGSVQLSAHPHRTRAQHRPAPPSTASPARSSASQCHENGHWPLRVDRNRLDRAAHQHMYILGRPSATNFTMMGASGNAYSVQLSRSGGAPHCTCLDHRIRKTTCKHILFVLMRALGLRKEELLSGVEWAVVESAAGEDGLFAVDAEYDVDDDAGNVVERPKKRRKVTAVAREVKQRPVDGEESCPICCCDFGEKSQAPLVFCRFSCGKSLHLACFKKMAAFQRRARAPLLCVYCRHPWD